MLPMPERKTPREILSADGKLEKDVIAVKVRDKTVDLHTPIDTAGTLRPIRANDPDGLPLSATPPHTSWQTPFSGFSQERRSPSAPP